MAPDLTFGPPGEEWHYDRTTKTYDLTRGRTSPRPLKFGTTQGPGATFITVAPAIAALVVVDMQNFFLHPSCRVHPKGLAAVEPTLRVIEKCRELGIQVCTSPPNWQFSSGSTKPDSHTSDNLAKLGPNLRRPRRHASLGPALLLTLPDPFGPGPVQRRPRGAGRRPGLRTGPVSRQGGVEQCCVRSLGGASLSGQGRRVVR